MGNGFSPMHKRWLFPVLMAGSLIAVPISGCRSKPPMFPTSEPAALIPDENRPVSRPATRNAGKAENPLPLTLAAPPLRIVRHAGNGPKDPRPPIQLGARFDIYDIVFPAGAVSRNDAFWKHIDEEKIDPGTYDVLRRNGIRVGIAPVSDWTAMRDLLNNSPSTTHLSTASGRDLTNLEITLKPEVLAQSIFVFMPDRSLVGRTFERCENLMTVSFQQLPRKPGQLRVTMSPRVRSTRKQVIYTALGNEHEYAFTYPEKALDVNLRADVPQDFLLVVAPSEEANLESSLGRAFLMQDSPTEKQEHVLFMVPHMYKVEDENTAGAATNPPPELPQ